MTEGQPGRARVALVVVGVLVALVTLALLPFFGWQAALGYFGGALVAAGMLGALVFCAERLVVAPGEEPARRWPYLLLHVGKLGAAIGLVVVLVVVLGASVAAFAAGYGTMLGGFLIDHSLRQAVRATSTTGREAEK